MDTKFINQLLALFLVLFTCHDASAADASATERAGVFGCYQPHLNSFWRVPDSSGEELVVIYSIQGLWADLETRLPKDLLELMMASSKSALASNPIELTARDIEKTSAAFYASLRKGLADSSGVVLGLCSTDTELLVRSFRERYKFYLRNAVMDSWYVKMHINELNVKNEQFAALLANGSEIKGNCETAWTDGRNRITVCK